MSNEISGILVVDKPEGITSANVVRKIKRFVGISKIGHTGTLDPMASGVMVCTINQATRLSRFFLAAPKKYAAVLKLGVETDTLDATGRITATHPRDGISDHDVITVCRQFIGEIDQIPPAYSALKHNGVPLYKYARKGIPVIKAPRKVFISYIHITDIHLPDIRFETKCSSGTYIRSLCADIGKALGCGGHLTALRRIACGGFSLKDAIPLADIKSYGSLAALRHRILPMNEALSGMVSCCADLELAKKIKYGQNIALSDIALNASPSEKTGQNPLHVKVIGPKNQLLAVIYPDHARQRYNYCCVFHNP